MGKLAILTINEECDLWDDPNNVEVYELVDELEEDDEDDINDPILEEKEPKSSMVLVEEPLKEVNLGPKMSPERLEFWLS